MKKILGVVVAIIVSIGFLGWFFFAKPAPLEVETAVTKRENITSTATATGKIDSEEIVELSFEIAGEIAWIGPKVGNSVKTGQAIAALNRRDLEIGLSQKEAAQRAAQSDLEKVLDDIRLFQLSNPQILETQTQKNLREKAESAKDQATEAVNAAREAVKKSALFAPIDGILVSKNTQVGQNVQGFVPVFKVANFSKVIFTADVDQTDIGKIKVGQSAIIALDTFPAREITATVVRISPETSTTSTGATIVKTEIKLAEVDFPLQLGLTGDTQIITEQRGSVLTIPIDAVIKDEGRSFVFVVENKIVRKHEIKTGLETSEKVEIAEGISENSYVSISNLDKLIDGQKVRIKK